MAGAFLLSTMTNESALAVLTLYDHLFTDAIDKQVTFEKMKLIDRIATQMISEEEDRLRESAEKSAAKPPATPPRTKRARR